MSEGRICFCQTFVFVHFWLVITSALQKLPQQFRYIGTPHPSKIRYIESCCVVKNFLSTAEKFVISRFDCGWTIISKRTRANGNRITLHVHFHYSSWRLQHPSCKNRPVRRCSQYSNSTCHRRSCRPSLHVVLTTESSYRPGSSYSSHTGHLVMKWLMLLP